MSDPEDLIERSWEDNADAWIRAVRLGTIASRALTDRAMLDAIISIGPSKVLDLGCGEGWLTRELGARGIAALGVDRSKALIEQARRGPGDFRQLSYDQIDAHWQVLSAGTPIDLVACHFSLLGESSTEQARGCHRTPASTTGGAADPDAAPLCPAASRGRRLS